MAKLSEIYKTIGNYIELHGDKDVTSIASHCGSSEYEYTLNLHDIHKGNMGSNPYSGQDKINISKSQSC